MSSTYPYTLFLVTCDVCSAKTFLHLLHMSYVTINSYNTHIPTFCWRKLEQVIMFPFKKLPLADFCMCLFTVRLEPFDSVLTKPTNFVLCI